MTKEQKPFRGNKAFFNKWFWFKLGSACRRMLINPFLSPCTKLKFKWIKDLNIKTDTLKLIEEKVEKNLKHMSIGEIFLNRKINGLCSEIKNQKWDLIKLQIFYKA